MILNYLKVALRNLTKGGLYSAINLLGLMLGTATCILIMLYVLDEYSYDKFHAKSNEIYRVWVKEHVDGDVFFNSVTPFILGTELKENIPECKEVMQYLTINSNVKRLSLTDQERIHVAQASFFDLFDFEILQGEKSDALSEIHNVIITPSVAKKYFGSGSPIGQTIALQVGGSWTDFTVSAIVEEAPSNASHQYTIIIPFDNIKAFTSDQGRSSWTIVFPETYVWIDEQTDLLSVQKKIATMVDSKVADIYAPGEYEVGLQPLTDIHLNPDIPVGNVAISDRIYPQILSAIALLILLLACINFTSLAIGRSLNRAKEVGVRKVSGAHRSQIMFQFWTEAILTVSIALISGLFLAAVCLPWFNTLASKNLALAPTLGTVTMVVSIALVTGLLAGMYPSVILSRFAPIQALRGSSIDSKGIAKHKILRWLVGFQYLLSIILIMSTLVMKNQLKYIQSKNLGFDKEHLVVVPFQISGESFSEQWKLAHQIEARLTTQVLQSQEIIDLATSSHTPGTPGWMRLGFTDQNSGRFRNFIAQQVSDNYLDLMKIDVIEGRDFRDDALIDLKSAIINKAMAAAYNLDDPIGKTLPGPFMEYQIIGVTNDFQYASLHSEVMPLVMVKEALPLFQAAPDMVSNDGVNPKFTFKIKSENIQSTLSVIEDLWSQNVSGQPFNFSFIEENIDRQYTAEARLSKIITVATALALVLAVLGLFGIALLSVVQRKKEIGIRKVLGASPSQIILLVAKKFSIMVLISAIIAAPVTWALMSNWLDNFAYRISLSPVIFVVAALVALVLSWISVSTPTMVASRLNPVDSLRESQ